jgi:uncharacterized protein YndB with AHSA1/START domain
MENRIEKHVVLKASLDRVWEALTDSQKFGVWFGMELDGPFIAGQPISGRIRPTQMDPEVAKMQEPYSGLPVSWVIDRIEPKTLFSMRWHPYAIDRDIDYSGEPMTLITFTLKETGEGVELTVTESLCPPLTCSRRSAMRRGWPCWRGWARGRCRSCGSMPATPFRARP